MSGRNAQEFRPVEVPRVATAYIGYSRRSHTREQAAVDLAWLRWIDRFKFVNARVAGEGMGVSDRAARSRLARLTREGWLRCMVGDGLGAERLYCIAPAGSELLGNWPRKPFGSPRDYLHELTIIRRVIANEKKFGPGVRVLTERECRRAEARGEGKYSLKVDRGRKGLRWPDLVLVGEDWRWAVEIELTQKTRERYRELVKAYVYSQYQLARYVTPIGAVERTVTGWAEVIRDVRLGGVDRDIYDAMDKTVCKVVVQRIRPPRP